MVSDRVFLGRLPFEVRTRDIEDFLEDHGFRNYRNIILKNGYGFVDFANSKDADDAVRELDRKDILGQRIVCEAAKGEKRRDSYDRRDRRSPRDGMRDRHSSRYSAPYNTEWRIIVKNLSSRVGWQELKDLFRQHGNVTYAECNKNVRGEGLVEYATEREMRKAISRMQGMQFYGRSIKLVDDAPGNKRKRSESSPRRSRRRSRSYSSADSKSVDSPPKAKSRSRTPKASPNPRDDSD